MKGHKLTAILLVVGLVMSVVGASAPVTAGTTEAPELVLSLEEAINLALEKNPQVTLNRLGIEKGQLAVDQAKSGADKAEDAEEILGASLETAQARYVAPRAAQMQLLLAEKGAVYQENVLKLTVESKYYDVLKAEKALANAQAALERAEEQLKIAEVSFKAGTVAKSDVMGAEVGVASARAQLTVAENQYQLAMMQLANSLGLNLDTRIKLTTQFQYEPVEIDLSQALAAAKENDLALIQARETEAVKKVDFDQVKKFYTPNVYAYREAQYAYEEARTKLVQAERDLELRVRTAYSNLLAAEKAYQVLEESYELAKETKRIGVLKYEAGVGTSLEMKQAVDNLNQVEAQMLEALYNYNLAKAQFRYGIFQSTGTAPSAFATGSTGDQE